jgi:hypothetical protein
MMNDGNPVSIGRRTNSDGQVGVQTAQKNSPDLTSHQTFRLTSREKDRLYRHAKKEKVSVSTLLRRLINEVTDGNE